MVHFIPSDSGGGKKVDVSGSLSGGGRGSGEWWGVLRRLGLESVGQVDEILRIVRGSRGGGDVLAWLGRFR